jgi:ABC-type phosphate transport system auxiliary subunit
MAQTTSLQPGDDEKRLNAGQEPDALASGEDNNALPAGYEVLVSDGDEEQVEKAEEFGEELTSIRNLIQRYADQADTVRDQVKEVRDSLKNIFDNDTELQELEEQAKQMTTDVKSKRQRLKESPEAVQLQMKAKEMKEELGEIEDTLKNYLLRYYQMTGSTVIEDDSGDEREIRINAKLSSKKSNL